MKLSCIWHDVFHIYCPGCGGTRALKELLAFHPGRSLIYNPLPLLLLVYLLIFLGTLILEKKKKMRGRYGGIRIKGLVVCAAVFLAYGLLRDVFLIGFQIDWLGDF